MKVLFITTIPSPYRVAFFNELGKLCDLTVLFERKKSEGRDRSWGDFSFDYFKGVFLKVIKIGKIIISTDIKKYLIRNWDFIICQNISTKIGLSEIRFLKRKKINYFLEVDGGFAKSGKGIKEWIKKCNIKGANGYFSTGFETDQYLKMYGADENRIYRYPFTSINSKTIIPAPISSQEKISLRKELGIIADKLILSVGQFIYRKGFDILLKSIPLTKTSANYVIIGGKPTEEYLNIIKGSNIKNVTFIEFINPEKLKKYFLAADFFVLPTREDIWGLVINEAMAYGLPVITTNRCIAGLEMVKEGENGYIISVDNEYELAEKIDTLLEIDLHDASYKSILVAQNYTIEKMAEAHLTIFTRFDNEYNKENI